jgi:hypothetical protein
MKMETGRAMSKTVVAPLLPPLDLRDLRTTESS